MVVNQLKPMSYRPIERKFELLIHVYNYKIDVDGP